MYDFRAIAIGALVGALECAIGDALRLRRKPEPEPRMTLRPARRDSMVPWSLRW